MSSFRSVIVICITVLVIAFFSLTLIETNTRYQFLVKGDVCIAFDRKESALKIIGASGCITIPLIKTAEQQMRELIEADVSKKIQKGLLGKNSASNQ
ncbi:MAG: hypothetical protein LBD36_00880 [Holosporales bacterium]|jgi:uncharacterized membrane protein YqiK|nr:hypothetical protein [Holosporales bacterium]